MWWLRVLPDTSRTLSEVGVDGIKATALGLCRSQVGGQKQWEALWASVALGQYPCLSHLEFWF